MSGAMLDEYHTVAARLRPLDPRRVELRTVGGATVVHVQRLAYFQGSCRRSGAARPVNKELKLLQRSMRVLTAARARMDAFDCRAWSRLATNASRAKTSVGGFVHDAYEAPFTGDFERAAEALLRYRIFAPGRMYAHVCTADGIVAVDATIVQRVVFGPAALETAVRVIELERLADRVGFAYATLQGHPECGVASFAVIRVERRHKFQAHAWSRPGNILTMLTRRVSRRLQRAMTREAVDSFCSLNG